MTKFEVLQINKILENKCIYSYHLTSPIHNFWKSASTYYILLVLTCFPITSSSVFVYRNLSQFELALQTIRIVIAGFQSAGMFLSIGSNMDNVKALHFKLQKIVNEEGT